MNTKIMGLLCVATLTHSLYTMETTKTSNTGDREKPRHSLSVHILSPDAECFIPNPSDAPPTSPGSDDAKCFAPTPKPSDAPPTSPGSDKIEMPKITYTLAELLLLHRSPLTPKASETFGTYTPLRPAQSPHDPYAGHHKECYTLAQRIAELGLLPDQTDICTVR